MDAALDAIADLVESARAMPLSASCVVPRAELLALVEDARTCVPTALAQAEQVLLERDALLERAREQARSLVEQGRAEQDRLVSTTAVFTRAQADADRLFARADHQSRTVRDQTDRYADAKLESFEVVLTNALATVQRGRARLGVSDPPMQVEQADAADVQAGDESGQAAQASAPEPGEDSVR